MADEDSEAEYLSAAAETDVLIGELEVARRQLRDPAIHSEARALNAERVRRTIRAWDASLAPEQEGDALNRLAELFDRLKQKPSALALELLRPHVWEASRDELAEALDNWPVVRDPSKRGRPSKGEHWTRILFGLAKRYGLTNASGADTMADTMRARKRAREKRRR